ncbi:patatin-like phospholipase family protein [Spirochaetota bacterium]
MSGNLHIAAGKKALSIIRTQGLKPEMVKVMAGAAGGPKWLVLSGLDQAICSNFIKYRSSPLFFMGSSIGAWRFAAYCHRDPLSAVKRLQSVYISQRYSEKPTTDEISRETLRVMNDFVGHKGIDEILDNPLFRLNILSSRCRGVVKVGNRAVLTAVLGLAALFNMVNRKLLGIFFNRALFYDSRNKPPFFNMNDFKTETISLSKKNLRPAMMASAAIPLVINAVKDIPGAESGVYRDGGMIDYHHDIPFLNDENGIVLYPHYSDQIIPGWFDKPLKWRRPGNENIENVVLVSPSRSFIDKLPFRKIPDRKDFKNFKGNDVERVAYWEKVTRESHLLGDEFINLVETEKISEVIKPL